MYKGTLTISDIFDDSHPEANNKADVVTCMGHIRSPGPSGVPTGEGVMIDWDTPLEALKTLGVSTLTFKCTEITQSEPKEKPRADAFSVLMASGQGRPLPAVKTSLYLDLKTKRYLPIIRFNKNKKN